MAESPPKGFRRTAVRAAAATLACYLGLVAAACLFQRSLMYFPDPAHHAPAVAGVPIEEVRLTTRDGERLVAWRLAPQPGKPVILFFDGNGDSLALQTGRWRRIAAQGVGFVAVSYRGYGGSTGHPTEAGLNEDAEAAYAWTAARYPPDQIVIHGFSLGTGVAVRVAAEHPARALVLEAPFTSAEDVAAMRFPWAPARWLIWDRYPSKDRIAQVRMPILVVHGDRDSVIPYAFGRALYGMARAPKRFVTIPGGDHNTLVRDGLYGHVWAFLGLPPAAAAS